MDVKTMTVSDWVQVGVLGTAVLGYVAGAVNRWSVANKADRLAWLSGFAARAAGRVNLDLQSVPPGADLTAVRNALIAAEAKAGITEFAQTAGKAGATQDKLSGMIAGELGALVGVPSPAGV